MPQYNHNFGPPQDDGFENAGNRNNVDETEWQGKENSAEDEPPEDKTSLETLLASMGYWHFLAFLLLLLMRSQNSTIRLMGELIGAKVSVSEIGRR